MIPYFLLIGAFERDNFGDMLFPKIIEKYFGSYPAFKAGLVGRDLTHIGGDIVVPVNDFFAGREDDLPFAVIHCGGETLTNLKSDGLAMNLATKVFEEDRGLFSFCQEEISEKLINSVSPFSYVYGSEDLAPKAKKKIPTLFISVGGSSLDLLSNNFDILESLKRRLRQARYLSVRDKKTLELLHMYLGLKADLYPDLAAIIHRTHKKEIAEASRLLSNKGLTPNRPYILFQINQVKILEYGLDILARKTAEIAKAQNMAIVLQPAGVASGHGSTELLRLLKERVEKLDPKITVKIQEDRNLWLQVAVIANSSCTIGTSLHVRIVSTAFERPRVSLPVGKVNRYIDTWVEDDQPYDVSLEDLPEAVARTMATDPQKLKKASTVLADKVEEGIEKMISRLNMPKPKPNRMQDQERMAGMAYSALSLETERLRQATAMEVIEKEFYKRKLNGVLPKGSWKITNLIRKVAGYRKR